jgi:hypothetical protein
MPQNSQLTRASSRDPNWLIVSSPLAALVEEVNTHPSHPPKGTFIFRPGLKSPGPSRQGFTQWITS